MCWDKRGRTHTILDLRIGNDINSGYTPYDKEETARAHRCQLNVKPLQRLLFDD